MDKSTELVQSRRLFQITLPSLTWLAIWRRNLRVWRKLLIPSLLGNFAEPLLYLVAIGYGLGQYVGEMMGLPYVLFLATGIVCSNAMNVASFEGMYSAYSRMAAQKTWDGILVAPVSVSEVVLGENVWIATKTLINSACILLVMVGLGLIQFWHIFIVLPTIFLAGFCFGSLALIVTSFAKSYDFFLYYFTLMVSPMLLLSGVFFPIDALPGWLQNVMFCLPLSHIVAIVRPLLSDVPLTGFWLHTGVLLSYAGLGYYFAVIRLQRRLIG